MIVDVFFPAFKPAFEGAAKRENSLIYDTWYSRMFHNPRIMEGVGRRMILLLCFSCAGAEENLPSFPRHGSGRTFRVSRTNFNQEKAIIFTCDIAGQDDAVSLAGMNVHLNFGLILTYRWLYHVYMSNKWTNRNQYSIDGAIGRTCLNTHNNWCFTWMLQNLDR